MKKRAKTTLTFSVDLEHDADILTWARDQENLSAAMRQVVREHITNAPRLGDVLAEVRELAAKVEAGNTG